MIQIEQVSKAFHGLFSPDETSPYVNLIVVQNCPGQRCCRRGRR
jgi:hypothetical protein